MNRHGAHGQIQSQSRSQSQGQGQSEAYATMGDGEGCGDDATEDSDVKGTELGTVSELAGQSVGVGLGSDGSSTEFTSLPTAFQDERHGDSGATFAAMSAVGPEGQPEVVRLVDIGSSLGRSSFPSSGLLSSSHPGARDSVADRGSSAHESHSTVTAASQVPEPQDTVACGSEFHAYEDEKLETREQQLPRRPSQQSRQRRRRRPRPNRTTQSSGRGQLGHAYRSSLSAQWAAAKSSRQMFTAAEHELELEVELEPDMGLNRSEEAGETEVGSEEKKEEKGSSNSSAE